jgi:hypothetical protein
VTAYEKAVAAANNAPAVAPPIEHPGALPALTAPPVASRRGPIPIRPGLGSIEYYTSAELTALIRWIQSDMLLRTHDELLNEAITTLGFQRKGKRIVDALEAAITDARRY